MTLTRRQAQVLTCIEDYVADRGYPPSVREIGEAVGLTSTSSVTHVLRVLEKDGRIRRASHGQPRTLAVVPGSAAEPTLQERWLTGRGECA